MARYYEPTPEHHAIWIEWVSTRPANVRAVAERFDPWSLYLLKPTGQRVTIHSFSEEKDGAVSLTVNVLREFNAVLFERQVFGINPDDLEPCELPDSSEPVGAVLSHTEVEDNIDALRVLGRPDLWELDEHGKAQRKS